MINSINTMPKKLEYPEKNDDKLQDAIYNTMILSFDLLSDDRKQKIYEHIANNLTPINLSKLSHIEQLKKGELAIKYTQDNLSNLDKLHTILNTAFPNARVKTIGTHLYYIKAHNRDDWEMVDNLAEYLYTVVDIKDFIL